MDAAAGAAQKCMMGQALPSERCEHCGAYMVLVMPVDGKGPRAFRCLECDRIDPLELPSIMAWLGGELRPPNSRPDMLGAFIIDRALACAVPNDDPCAMCRGTFADLPAIGQPEEAPTHRRRSAGQLD